MRYIKYMIDVLEPVKIVDLNASSMNQLVSLSYIPGSTIRGVVMNQCLSDKDFEIKKKLLLSEKVCFMNAYPYMQKKYLMPSPKGFYEKKQQDGNLKNGFVCQMEEGDKSAALGEFGCMKSSTFYYMDVKKEESLNINIGREEKTHVYRNDYIAPSSKFAGFIGIKDSYYLEYKTKLIEDLNHTVRIGSRKSSGYGKVKITAEEYNGIPYGENNVSKEDTKNLYMMCLSPLAMLNEYGENCGIDECILAEKLGIGKIQVIRCASEVIRKSGLNRTWGSRTPEYTMYAPGSIFLLKGSEIPDKDKIQKIEDEGIGISRNEGCGRVIFLKGFDQINQKKLLEADKVLLRELEFDVDPSDLNQLMRVAARNMVRSQLEQSKEVFLSQNDINSYDAFSQDGMILSLCNELKYSADAGKAIEKINGFINHAEDKRRRQKVHFGSVQTKDFGMMQLAKKIINQSIRETFPDVKEECCGIKWEELFSDEEILYMKLDLISSVIRMKNRGGKQA